MSENRYVNSRVYKLVDNDGFFYYGSTCLPLHKRFYCHKNNSKQGTERKIYKLFTHTRFVNGEIKIVLVKEFQLNSKEELSAKENEYIVESLNDPLCLNSVRAIKDYEVTRQKYIEYYYLNREKLIEYQKEYRVENKEKYKKRGSNITKKTRNRENKL